MKTISFLLIALLCVTNAVSASAALAKVVFYQPNDVLQSRLGGLGPLTEYLKSVRSACDASLAGAGAEGVDVVIIIKPGGQSRVWLDSSAESAPDRSELKAKLEAIAAPNVKDGPVAVAMLYNLNGFSRIQAPGAAFQPPIPKKWKEKATDIDGPIIIPDGFMRYVWPD